MYNELYKYLILHKQLSLPGIGRFEIEKKPADVDFANRVVNPPEYSISFRQSDTVIPFRKLFNWLETELNISELEAVKRFNDFVFDMRARLAPDNQLHWEGVGTIKKWLNGEIMYIPDPKKETMESSIPAKKVIREKAQHTITVGEQERTSDEMMEMLFPGEVKRSYWWTVPLIIAIAAFVYIAYHFSANGVSVSSAANQQKLEIQQTPSAR